MFLIWYTCVVMLVMRLQRVGRRNNPSFRIVVTDRRTGVKSKKHIDRIGFYDPKIDQVQLDTKKAKDWLSHGVQPSDTVYNILVSEKVLTGKKRNVLPKKTPIIKEEEKNSEETKTDNTGENTQEEVKDGV